MRVDPHVGEPVILAVEELRQLLYLDLKGHIVTSPNCEYKYVLVAVDVYSKFTFLEPLKNKTGQASFRPC